MSINISLNQFRLRMQTEQFELLQKSGSFIEVISENNKDIFFYSVKISNINAPLIEFFANEIKIYLPTNIISQLNSCNKKEGVEFKNLNSFNIFVQLDIKKNKF